MSDDVADRAEAALEGTSPEPWHIPRSGQGIDSGEYGTVIERGNVKCMSYCYGGSSTIEGDNLGADLRFIAAARSLVPELVAELKTTRAQLAAVRELHKPRWLNCINYCCSGEECRNRYRGCICDEEWPCSTARQVYSADELGAAEAVTDA